MTFRYIGIDDNENKEVINNFNILMGYIEKLKGAFNKMKKNVSISLIILSILAVSIFLFNFHYTDYNSGIKLYQKGYLNEAKIKLMNVTPQDKKYAEAQNMISIIDQKIENARIKEEAEKESLRIKEITQLEEEVKEVPYSDYEKNYQMYQRLCELDPNNDGYLKKMNQYKTLYAKQVDEH